MEQELLPSVFSGVRVSRTLVFYVFFCRLLLVLLSFFLLPLHCLSFFKLRLMITPLVSLNFSSEEMEDTKGVTIIQTYSLK